MFTGLILICNMAGNCVALSSNTTYTTEEACREDVAFNVFLLQQRDENIIIPQTACYNWGLGA